MERRQLGKTGLEVSVLSFGCGAVGGLMTRGEPRDQERAVARALELGINYFDTAALYGNGASETNLGRVLAKLKPEAIIATKVRVAPRDRGRIGAAVAASLEASLEAPRPRQRRHLPLPQHVGRRRRRRDLRPRCHAQRGAAGLRAPAQAGQDAPHRHHGRRRDAAAPAPRRGRRLRDRADLLQRPQSDGRPDAARRLPGAGLPRPDAARPQGGHGYHRHPRAGRRRAERQHLAAPAGDAGGPAHRLGRRLSGRPAPARSGSSR